VGMGRPFGGSYRGELQRLCADFGKVHGALHRALYRLVGGARITDHDSDCGRHLIDVIAT
jgi:hypothetical protein